MTPNSTVSSPAPARAAGDFRRRSIIALLAVLLGATVAAAFATGPYPLHAADVFAARRYIPGVASSQARDPAATSIDR